MVAKKPLVRTSGGPGLTEAQLASADLSDGPFATVGQTMYLGTTGVAINRASAALSLAGVSIDGDAGTLGGHAAAYFQIAGSYLTDAPSDGSTYGRKNATWSAVTSGAGDVVGPAGATSGHVAVFAGATGKLLKDGGAISTDGSTERVLSANLTIAAGRSYVVCGPLKTNGFILSIAATGRMRVL